MHVDGSNKLNKMGKMLTDVYMGRCIKNTDIYTHTWIIAMFSLNFKNYQNTRRKRTTKLALVFLTQDHKTWLTGRAMLLKSDWLT